MTSVSRVLEFEKLCSEQKYKIERMFHVKHLEIVSELFRVISCMIFQAFMQLQFTPIKYILKMVKISSEDFLIITIFGI